MPREVNGKSYLTLDETAREFGVSARTLKNYLNKGVVTAPSEINHGLRTYYAFTPDWVTCAIAEIASKRKKTTK